MVSRGRRRPSSAPRACLGAVSAAGLLLGAAALAGCGGAGTSTAAGSSAQGADRAAPTKPATPTRITRWPKLTGRDGSADVTVRLSATPAASAPHPTLSPHVAGSWSVHGRFEVFTPASTLSPCGTYRLKVPAGTTATGHASLGHARAKTLHVACPTTRSAQTVLARLHYLPYEVHGGHGASAASGTVSRHEAAAAIFSPSGKLERRYADAPSLDRGSLDQTTRGALMALQQRHGLTVDGLIGPSTWRVLLADDAAHRTAEGTYTWVTVSKAEPESLTVHRGNEKVLSTPANTGAAGADTPEGTFPIFEHVPASDMKGTNPDGSTYDDKGVPWVSYFNGGDAVHGFERASYGSRQSNGCVELPVDTAKRVYEYLDIGDLVVVSS